MIISSSGSSRPRGAFTLIIIIGVFFFFFLSQNTHLTQDMKEFTKASGGSQVIQISPWLSNPHTSASDVKLVV